MRQQRPEMHRRVEVRRALALLVLVVCAGTACSDDNATANSASQSDGATAPSGSAGPSPSTAGAGDSGVRSEPSADASGAAVDASAARVDASAPDGAASTASSGLPEVYVCQAMLAAHPPDPSGQGAEGSPCCGGRGSCQRRSSIALELKAALGHDSCQASAVEDLACAPTPAVTPKACHGETGAASLEGRCLPSCFLLGTPTALLLTSSDCGADEACGACYDPVTGEATGACSLQPADRPKEPAPAPFKPCGVYDDVGPSAGVCMPKVLAHASNNPVVDLLPRDVCSDAEVCMPNLKAANHTACFKPCETSALVQAAGSKEGGCIPPYIAAFTNPEAIIFLDQDTCAAGELCAPCLDPTKDFAVSGACN